MKLTDNTQGTNGLYLRSMLEMLNSTGTDQAIGGTVERDHPPSPPAN